jgi:hypothetical protein
MSMKSVSRHLTGSLEDLLFHADPDARLYAATRLGYGAMGVSVQRSALEALTTALRDPCANVQDAVLQSLMRLSAGGR